MQRATLAASAPRGINPRPLVARHAVAPIAGRFAAPRHAGVRALCRASKKPDLVKVTFSSPQHVHFCEELRIVGGLPELGAWKIEDAPALRWTKGDKWTLNTKLPSGKHQYKLVIYNVDSGASYWEQGHNRELEVEEPVTVQLSWEKPEAFKSYEEPKDEELAAVELDVEEEAEEAKAPPALAVEPTLETVALPSEPVAASKNAVEEPVAELPAPEEPVAELPAPEEPVAELPAPEEPVAELPAPEEPVAELPAPETSATAEPAVEAAATEEPASAPAATAAVVEETVAEVKKVPELEPSAAPKEEAEAKMSDAEETVAVARAAAAATSSTAASATATTPQEPAAPKGRGRRKSTAQPGTRASKPRARRASRKPRE